MVKILSNIWNFYLNGFKGMTWGKTLWIIILIKLFIMFAILRVFFFRPSLEGKTEKQKIETVGKRLMQKPERELLHKRISNSNTIKLQYHAIKRD